MRRDAAVNKNRRGKSTEGNPTEASTFGST